MTRWLFIAILLFVSGCGLTSEGDFFRDVFKEKGKKAAVQSLDNAEWWICRGSPVGPVKDRYGGRKAAAYHYLCKTDPTSNIIVPGIFMEDVTEKEEVVS